MNGKEMYPLFWFCVKTITSAPSRIVLVLKPFPSDTRSNINSMVEGFRLVSKRNRRKDTKTYIAQWKHQTAYPKIQSSCNVLAPQDPSRLHHLMNEKHHKVTTYNPDSISYKINRLKLQIWQPWTNNEGFPSRGFLNLLTRTNVAPLFTWEKRCHKNNNT